MAEIKIIDSFEYNIKGDKPGIIYTINETRYGYVFKVIKQGEKWFEFPNGHNLGMTLIEELDIEVRKQKFANFKKYLDEKEKRE